jgi:hypothetical protein
MEAAVEALARQRRSPRHCAACPRGIAQVAAVTAFRWVARAWPRRTAMVAASRAAPMAMRAICQPGMPPPVTRVMVRGGEYGRRPARRCARIRVRVTGECGVATKASRTSPARPGRRRDGGCAHQRPTGRFESQPSRDPLTLRNPASSHPGQVGGVCLQVGGFRVTVAGYARLLQLWRLGCGPGSCGRCCESSSCPVSPHVW